MCYILCIELGCAVLYPYAGMLHISYGKFARDLCHGAAILIVSSLVVVVVVFCFVFLTLDKLCSEIYIW